MTSDPPPAAAPADTDDEPDPRVAGRLLAGLLQTPALDRFRRRRLGADSTVDLAHLARARDLLRAVATAITRNEPDDWQRLQAAWQALHEWVSPADEGGQDTAEAPDFGEAGHDTLPQMPAARPPALSDPAPMLPPPLLSDPTLEAPPPRPSEQHGLAGDAHRSSPWASHASRGPDAAVIAPPPGDEGGTLPGVDRQSQSSQALPFAWAEAPAGGGGSRDAESTDVESLRDPDTEPPGPPPGAVVLPFAETLPRASSPGILREDWQPLGYADLTEQTAALDGDCLWSASADDAVTFAGRSASSISVEEYAALCVRCEKRPEQVEAAHEVFGVHGEKAREQLHRRWQLWLDSDPVLHRRWRALCAEFRLARS